MSAFTTLRITRTRARKEVLNYLLSEISDEKLGEFMDDVLRERLYNVQIVPDGSDNEEDAL